MTLVEYALLILTFLVHVNIKGHGRFYLIKILPLSANKTEHVSSPFFVSFVIYFIRLFSGLSK